ncbi:MAG TPA: helix-turn-helix domain-containing protein [Tepidisphaeraceae bacterium]|jgi:transposase
MSSQPTPGSQDFFAGAVPAERSGAGTAPANAAAGPGSPIPSELAATPPPPDLPVTPAPPDIPVTAAADDQPGVDLPAGDGTAGGAQPDEVPALPIDPRPFGAAPARLCGRGPRPARRLVSPQEAAAANRKLTAEQKLLILDTWQRSGLAANDFAALVGINRITLYTWKKKFEELGPAGLMDPPRKTGGGSGKVPDLTQRTILMVKRANPQWGCQRISDVLYRGPGLPASANTVARVLREAGYVLEEQATSPHPDKVRSFERAAPINCGRRICSPSCSSGRTAGSTWWRSWTITRVLWSATPCTPPARRRW